MARVLPLSQLPVVYGRMVAAAADIPDVAIRPIAKAVDREVDKQGGKYHVKGRKGGRVPLSGRIERGKLDGRYTESVSVAGNPPGFWRIIEEGSSSHLIAGRYRDNGRRRGARAATNQFLRGDSFAGSSPINIPGIGWRQNAVHPGHGSVGRPWRKSMDATERIVADVTKDEALKTFLKAWT